MGVPIGMTKSIAGLACVAPVDAPHVALTRNRPRNGTTPRGADAAAIAGLSDAATRGVAHELETPRVSGVMENATTANQRARSMQVSFQHPGTLRGRDSVRQRCCRRRRTRIFNDSIRTIPGLCHRSPAVVVRHRVI
jgi:hypothetical protein